MDFIPVLGLQKSVYEGHTSVYSVIHPPHICQKLWERVPSDKKKLCFCLFFSFCLYFSHGDVYQYLKELGSFFFDALPEIVVSFKLAHLPNVDMLPCGLIGKV